MDCFGYGGCYLVYGFGGVVGGLGDDGCGFGIFGVEFGEFVDG